MSCAAPEPPAEGAITAAAVPDAALEVERAIAELGERALSFARTPAAAKAALLAETLARLVAAAPAWVNAACEAKGVDTASAAAGEEWLAGPCATVAYARCLVDALTEIVDFGRPLLGHGAIQERDGRVTVRLLPQRGPGAAALSGHTLDAWMLPGVTRDDVTARQASFYRQSDPVGGVSLILGSDGASSAAPMGALHRLFVEGRVALIRIHPRAAWLRPHLQAALSPLIDHGVLRVACSGADACGDARHPGVGDVHWIGSRAAYESLVCRQPRDERAGHRTVSAPYSAQRVTAELGNVTPVIVVPWLYDKRELIYQARSIASQVVHQASVGCTAAHVLVLARGWPQRAVFLGLVRDALARVPTRRPSHPGAFERHLMLCAGRERVETIGSGEDGRLPWTIIHEPDPASGAEPLWRLEPLGSLLTVVSLGSEDPAELLDEATRFVNERLTGSLACSLVVHPLLHEIAGFSGAFDRTLTALRYGCIAINTWPGLAYGLPTAPWGSYAASAADGAQEDLGFVHGAAMLEGVQKVVLRAPLTRFLRPPFFSDRRTAVLGERLVRFAASPSWIGAIGLLPFQPRG